MLLPSPVSNVYLGAILTQRGHQKFGVAVSVMIRLGSETTRPQIGDSETNMILMNAIGCKLLGSAGVESCDVLFSVASSSGWRIAGANPRMETVR